MKMEFTIMTRNKTIIWPTKKLGEISKIRMGETLIKKDLTGDGVPVYSADSLEKPWGFTSKNKLEFSRGAIIVGARGTLGSVKLPDDTLFTSTQTTIILGPQQKVVNSTFLFYYLRKVDFKKLRGGSGIPMLTVARLNDLKIPLPPLPEQKKIVYILDNIQNMIRVQEKIIEKTKELKKSMMADLFKYGGPSFRKGRKLKKTEIGKIPENWEVVELGEITETTSNINLKGKPNKKIKYIDVSSISSEFLKIIEFKEYYGKNAPSRARKKIKTGDILFATVRPYLKRVAIVSNEFNEEICSTAFCIIRCKDNVIDSFFLFNYISTNSFIDRITFLQTGANYPAVSDKDLFIQKVPLPSFSEQREIADTLQTIDQKIEIEQKKKALYEELFKTMLNKLMTGEIKVDNLKI